MSPIDTTSLMQLLCFSCPCHNELTCPNLQSRGLSLSTLVLSALFTLSFTNALLLIRKDGRDGGRKKEKENLVRDSL